MPLLLLPVAFGRSGRINTGPLSINKSKDSNAVVSISEHPLPSPGQKSLLHLYDSLKVGRVIKLNLFGFVHRVCAPYERQHSAAAE